MARNMLTQPGLPQGYRILSQDLSRQLSAQSIKVHSELELDVDYELVDSEEESTSSEGDEWQKALSVNISV